MFDCFKNKENSEYGKFRFAYNHSLLVLNALTVQNINIIKAEPFKKPFKKFGIVAKGLINVFALIIINATTKRIEFLLIFIVHLIY